MTVRVRFAPSPTGHLHIGGVRTALFNWVFARHHKGTFILRIDDTDKNRSTINSLLGILKDFKWLGIDWDEGPSHDLANPMENQSGSNGPYFQSQRLHLYNKYITELLEKNYAYEDHSDNTEYQRNSKPAVRFKMPEHSLSFYDAACGTVTCSPDEFEDFIIRKSDGFPTYHFANVVDDELMGITHILRGQEHRTNTFKHIALQQALNFKTPEYCHFSLLFNPDGSKMSKRDKAKAARKAALDFIKIEGNKELLYNSVDISRNEIDIFLNKQSDDTSAAVKIADFLNIQLPEIDVSDYRDSGYRPEPLLNYLALLGWNPGDDIEKFDIDFMIERFDLTRIGSSNSKFNRKKLLHFNADYLHSISDNEFNRLFKEYCQTYAPDFLVKISGNFELFCRLYKKRSETLHDPLTLGKFFTISSDDIVYNKKAVKKILLKNNNEGLNTLSSLIEDLEPLNDWTIDNITLKLEEFMNKHNINLRKTAQPIRVAVSGNVITPEISETLYIIGHSETILRIKKCIEEIKNRFLPA